MRVPAHLININAAFRQPRSLGGFPFVHGGARVEHDLDGEAVGVCKGIGIRCASFPKAVEGGNHTITRCCKRVIAIKEEILKTGMGCDAFWVSQIYLFLFNIISAAITPDTQPQSVSRNTMSIEPQPRSNTAKGGKRMDRRTRRKDMIVVKF